MSNFIVRFQPRIGGGGVITYRAGTPFAATYWELRGKDPETQAPLSPHGELRYQRVKADAAGLAVNIYLAPKIAELAGQIDTVIVRIGADYA
jgi:hypothetical protein